MENKFQFLECEGLQIGAFIESRSLEEHSTYQPVSILFYVKKGKQHIRMDNELHTISKNQFCLLRKHTKGSVFKSWTKKEECAIVYAFILQDQFIKEALNEFQFDQSHPPTNDKVIFLPKNKILMGLFDTIVSYLTDNEYIDKNLVRLKTKEAILGILKFHPEYYSIFTQFATYAKADLREFMEFNYRYNISLKVIAESTGRSLSTFNREFKSIFNETPHRWILKRRLQEAKKLLLTTEKRPSEFYMDLGFEDLAHFSRTFKKAFGMSPREFSKSPRHF